MSLISTRRIETQAVRKGDAGQTNWQYKNSTCYSSYHGNLQVNPANIEEETQLKKKLIVGAVLTALTLSTASAFAAAPIFSGDANIEYNKETGKDRELTNRIRIHMHYNVDDDMYVHLRWRADNNIDTNKTTTEADQVYVGAKFDGVEVRGGKQPLWLGKGLLMDEELSGLGIITFGSKVSFSGFYGKDTSIVTADKDYAVTTLNMGTALGGMNVGAAYLKMNEGNNKYWGINADTKLSDNAVLNVEYVKNNDAKADGYLAEVKFGNAAKKGEIDYSISYRDIEKDAVSRYSTNGNYNDSKGVKIKATYKVSNAATLTVYHDMADTQAGAEHHRTNVEFNIDF